VIYAARFLRVEPELATSDATRTFQTRVQRAVDLAAEAGEQFADFDVEAQEAWYQRAKAVLSV
jgi:hypothetical protein